MALDGGRSGESGSLARHARVSFLPSEFDGHRLTRDDCRSPKPPDPPTVEAPGQEVGLCGTRWANTYHTYRTGKRHRAMYNLPAPVFIPPSALLIELLLPL